MRLLLMPSYACCSTTSLARDAGALHAQARWPALTTVSVRYRGVIAYIDGHLSDGTILPLCRLRYHGSASIWGFAIYLASRDGYEDNILPSGLPAGSPEEALDCACGLYLNDPTGWPLHPRRINSADHSALPA